MARKVKKQDKEGYPARPKKKIDKTLEEAREATEEVEKKRKKKARAKARKDGKPLRKVWRDWQPTPLQLTNQLAQHIAIMWTHNLTDEVIYTSLGIPHKTFYLWLEENHPVTVELRYGKDTKKLTLGFKELKERMKAFFEPSYLMRLENIVDKSEAKEDYRTASSNLRWLMGKRLPRKYGREADTRIGSDQVDAICNSIFQIIFKHVKDPEILEKIQDDLDKLKSDEEQKTESLNQLYANEPANENMDDIDTADHLDGLDREETED